MRRLPLWLAVGAAFILQSVGARYQWAWMDLMMVPVVFASMRRGPAKGMLTGMAAGLMEDSLCGGLFGLHAFGKTLAGYLASRARKVLLVEWQSVRILVLVGCYLVDGLTVAALNVLLLDESWSLGGLWLRTGLSTLLALGGLWLLETADKSWTARRERL